MRTSDQPIRISLIAPEGRMGQAIAAAVAEDGGYALDQDHGDVLVDFSAPAALQAILDRAVSAGVPILIGTTGLDELADRRMAEAAKDIAVLHAPNTSLGVALLADLVERAAKALDWDIEIAEIHHRMKADAPSGTAPPPRPPRWRWARRRRAGGESHSMPSADAMAPASNANRAQLASRPCAGGPSPATMTCCSSGPTSGSSCPTAQKVA
jgi:hypothetical protein